MRDRLTFGFALSGAIACANVGHAQHTSVHVAVYRDVGVWENEGSRALPAVLEWLGTSYRFISAAEINGGVLNKSGKPAFDLLIVPGGYAADYVSRVGGWSGRGPGDDEIRAFVTGGGNYLGFCAGAFAAAKTTRWLGRDYAYPWQLFDGVAEGPLPWNPLLRRAYRAQHGTAVLDLNAPELKGRGLPQTVRPMLYAGPRFIPRDPTRLPAQYRVLAKHGEDGSAAILSYRYPNASGGRVVLCSFHPSVLSGDRALFDRDMDNFAAFGAGTDPDGHQPDWQLAAALVDVALGHPARKPPPLPRAAGSVTLPATLRIGQANSIQLTQRGAAGADYALAASLSMVPGVRITPQVILPLTADFLLLASIQTPGVFTGFLGRLDAQGKATATLHVPSIASLRGTRLYFAFVTLNANGWFATSAPASAEIF